MTPADLAELIASEQVTFTAGVPTIWQGMMRLDPKPDLSSLKEIVCGGSAVPESLIRGFEEKFGVADRAGLGHDRDEPARRRSRASAPTRPTTRTSASSSARRRAGSSPLVDFPIDEETGGELQVRGPWVARAYYERRLAEGEVHEDGWLRTGDVAELADGGVHQARRPHQGPREVGRRVDLARSSSRTSSWPTRRSSRPRSSRCPTSSGASGRARASCRARASDLDADELREFLAERVAKWWIPERIEFIDEVPKTVGRQVRQEGAPPAPRRGGGLRQRVVTASHAPALRHDTAAIERLISDLVAIDSVNPDLVPGGAGEAEIAAFTAAWLREAGLEVVVDDPPGAADPPRPSVVGVARGRGGGRTLLLSPTPTRSASRG